MQRWEEHWFGPVAAIRPYVFQKCFTLMLAFDLLVLMVERGARYGADAVAFNVAHFRWLDALHSLIFAEGVPSATFYVCIVTLTSFLTFCLFFVGHRPWLMAIVCGLFTYAWSMSRLDSYLHHYMLSLVMLCMVFFPRIDGRDLQAWLNSENEVMRGKPKQSRQTPSLDGRTVGVSLVVLAFAYRIALSQFVGLDVTQRWGAMVVFFAIGVVLVVWGNSSVRPGLGPMVSAWSFRLLLTTVGVIYMFAAVAKMDAEWCGGHTLKAVGTTESVLQPVAKLAAIVGVPADTFWSILATFVIPLELTLGAIYLLSVWQDHIPILRRVCFVGWLLAIGLHLNNEMMNLIIQWFGYYMLMQATVLLMPSRILLIAGQAFIAPECWVRERVDKLLAADDGPSLPVVSLAALLALPAALGFAMLSMIPGIMVAAFILLFGIVLTVVVGIALGWNRRVLVVAMASITAFVTMTCAIMQCSMQFDYYDLRGKTLLSQGRLEEATQNMEAATAFRPPSKKASGELLTNLAICYVKEFQQQPPDQGMLETATDRIESTFRQAYTEDPSQFLAHYSHGNFLSSLNRIAEAQQQYRFALEIEPDFSDAYINLGSTYEFEGRIAEAIRCYEIAAEIEPHAQDVQQLLAGAKAKLEAN